MEVAILLALALLILVGVFVTRPLWLSRAVEDLDQPLSRQEALEAEKAALLDEIRALDFDYETGKIPEAVYQQQRQQTVQQAAAILQQLDELVETPTEAPAGIPEEIDREIEAAVARLRQTAAVPAPAGLVPAVSQRFCPQCGERRDAGDRFCAYCGNPF
jgi:hypothetical protein